MDTKFDFGDAAHNTVYIRSVRTDSLPDELQEQLEGLESLYSVHGEDGERLALVKDRKLAFILARQHDMTPVSVH